MWMTFGSGYQHSSKVMHYQSYHEQRTGTLPVFVGLSSASRTNNYIFIWPKLM